MENLLTRMKNIILSDLNETLAKKEQKNPIALLNQYLRECEKETEKVRKLLERQHALKDEFYRELKQAENMAIKRKQQADVAAQAGDNHLAQLVMEEQLYYEERASYLKVALNEAAEELNNLEKKYEQMKHKLKDMQIRQMELMGRENISRAHFRMNKVLQNNSYTNKHYSRFQEIESYLNRLENEVNHSYYRNTIDARIAQLEKELKSKESNSI